MTRDRLRSVRTWIAALGVATTVSLPLSAQIDCGSPGDITPATPVPECVDTDGLVVSCATAGSIQLWPTDFGPASATPLSRDSTDWIGFTLPGFKSGHELFNSLDVVTTGGVSRRLYVAYNAGLQVWDIETDPDHPPRLAVRDGFEGDFLVFPPPSGVFDHVRDVAAFDAGAVDVVAVAGSDLVGPSFWEFDPATSSFTQLYQDTGTDARQIRLLRLNDGTFIAVAATFDGIAVYNVSAARALGAPCVDDQGTACGDVFLGEIPEITSGKYLDAIHVPAVDRVLVAAGDGLIRTVQIWDLGDLAGTKLHATLQFDGGAGLVQGRGMALFAHGVHYYLGFVLNDELRIFLVDDCISGSACFLGPGSVEEVTDPISVGAFPSDDQLTFSVFNGRPYLYSSVGNTANISGPDLERLFDLSGLAPPDPLPLASLPEVTSTGGSYVDPCNASTVRYWSHYYSGNTHGLNRFVPRVAKLAASGHFYRAATTVLDVHLLGDGTPPARPLLTTAVTHPDDVYWMSLDVIGFDATESSCTPSALSWDWQIASTELEVDLVSISEITNTASYQFDCMAAGRCPDTVVTVQAGNGDCADAVLTPARIAVKDPVIGIVSVNAGGCDVFEASDTVDLSALIGGRGPLWWEWRVLGSPLAGCGSSFQGEDLATAPVECSMPARDFPQLTIFTDGFESGDTTRWGGSQVPDTNEVTAEVVIWDSADTSQIPLATDTVTLTVTGLN